MRKKRDVFKDKKEMYAISVDRTLFLPIPEKLKDLPEVELPSLKKEEVKIEMGINQAHRDILDAFIVAGKKVRSGQRVAVLANLSDVLRVLGHKTMNNHRWLKEKLENMRKTPMKIVRLHDGRNIIVTSIVQKFAYSEKYKKEECKHLFGMGDLFLVVFSEEFTSLMLDDFLLHMKPETIKAIINLPKRVEFLKLAVRYILTHEKINMKLEDLLRHLNITISDRTLRYYKLTIKKYVDYLKQHFNITVVRKDNDIYLFYKKDPRFIVIDYQKSQ